MTRTSTPAQVAARLRSLVAHPRFGPLPGLLLILTAVTGVVDAISILALNRDGQDRGALLRAGTVAEVTLVAVALVLAALSGAPGVSHGTTAITGGSFGPAVTDALAAVLATALGIQNAVARKLAVPDMTTTVLTMTLTGLGADLRAVLRGGGGGAGDPARAALDRRLLSIATMLAGALSGAALTLYTSPVSGLALALALLALATAGAVAAARRPAPWRTPPARG